MIWHPLLQGTLAARALEAVDAIAAALPEAPIEPPVVSPVEPEWDRLLLAVTPLNGGHS
jgi:hypothetical protein